MEPDGALRGSRPQLTRKSFYKNFVPELFLRKLWRYAQRGIPYVVKHRGTSATTRPKIILSIMRKEGDHEVFCCCRWGQNEEDWTLIEAPPRRILF